MYTDQEETNRSTGKAELNISKRKENNNLQKMGAVQITIDLVLQARAKLSDNKVNGPEDPIVSEMIKGCLWKRTVLLRDVFRSDFWV